MKASLVVPNLAADTRTLWRMLRGRPRRASHAESLQAFYAPQAERYDAFRARLLHGREELIDWLDIPAGARVVELGCGTGCSLDILGTRVAGLERLDLVDLCPALLDQARRRAAGLGTVQVHEADATAWQPPQLADRVFFSYSLSMIPNWRQAVDNALVMLAPGGRLGVVDFHLPTTAHWTNGFWRRWFAHDGVHLSVAHLAVLKATLPNHRCAERHAAVPYLPRLQAPYYCFVGRRMATDGREFS